MSTATRTRRAKVFTTGGSQAVRLPAEFRFEADEVYVRRDALTGDVILSARPHGSYADFIAQRFALGPVPASFLGAAERALGQETRDPFAPEHAPPPGS